MKRKLWLFLFVTLISSKVLAVDTEFRTLTPYVTIFGASSDAIKIQAKENTFSVRYSVEEQAFLPLDIPFDVVSLSGDVLNYRLTLPFQSAVCLHEGVAREIKNPSIRLDGAVWPEAGLPFNGSLNTHTMRFSFPVVEQKNTMQECYGVLGVRVEVMTL
ncbi:hypothetical protein ACB087_10125 (plasmid) [Vibrio sp. VNB-15]